MPSTEVMNNLNCKGSLILEFIKATSGFAEKTKSSFWNENFNFKYAIICNWIWLRWWRICLQCGRPGFDPWVGKIPWRREWQTTPVFLPGESHEQRSLAGYSPRGRNASNTTGRLTHIHSKGYFVFNISFIVDSAVCWPFSLRKWGNP